MTFVGNLYSTPLHYAAMQGQFEVVKKLLEWGSDPTVRNVNGQTPKDVATDYRVKSLLEQKQNLLETPIMTKYVFG